MMQREALEKQRRTLGEDHPNTILAANVLADTLSNQGQLDEAASILQEVLRKMQHVLHLNDPKIPVIMRKLTVLLDRINRQESVKLDVQALQGLQARVTLQQGTFTQSSDFVRHRGGLVAITVDEVANYLRQFQEIKHEFLEFQMAWDVPAFRAQGVPR